MNGLKSGQKNYFPMNSKKIMINEKIEILAEKVRKDLALKWLPEDMEKIIAKLGIKVKYAPSDEFSGLLIRKDGSALIGVNNNESSVRQRFTIAHELGHFFLHPTQDAFVDYRDNLKGVIRNAKEREANMFAAAFLMPKSLIISDVNKLSKKGIFESEIKELASKYNVSKESMSYRILNLGLIKG